MPCSVAIAETYALQHTGIGVASHFHRAHNVLVQTAAVLHAAQRKTKKPPCMYSRRAKTSKRYTTFSEAANTFKLTGGAGGVKLS